MSKHVITLYRSKKPGKCPYCGEPTLWRLGRPPGWKVIHPECYGLYRLNEDPAAVAEAEANAIYALHKVLGVTLIESPPVDRRGASIHIQNGPCSWCGQPGIGINADKYLHCRTHMWSPFRWPPPTPLPGGQQ